MEKSLATAPELANNDIERLSMTYHQKQTLCGRLQLRHEPHKDFCVRGLPNLRDSDSTTIDDYNNSVKADLEQLGIRIRFVAIKERASDDKRGTTYARIGTYVDQEEALLGADWPTNATQIINRLILMGDFNTPGVDWKNVDPVSPPGHKCDHVAIKLQSAVRPRQLKRMVKHRWIFNQEQSDAFRLSLSSVDWFLQLNGKSPTDQATILEEIVTTTAALFHKFVPYRLRHGEVQYPLSVRRAVKRRDVLFRQFRAAPPGAHREHRRLRRSQVTVVDGVQSDSIDVTSGVPQGSVLGPLLYICLVNAMRSSLSAGTKLALFADDSCPSRIIRSPSDTLALQDDLDSLGRWTQQRKLLQSGKSVHIRLSRKPHRLPPSRRTTSTE
ncbi:hypothetical protein BV898_19493 [Hypsibius exemplaris]|uniref:Reverse transcriptase domain-containing protein n=1 Tax=Hypsibius exemplaris TaxID=2072580 RepID=A0A9X6NL17_HYPEX|nr:hypothetical protein BV898_19493 [Hypsibius exemplaris]